MAFRKRPPSSAQPKSRRGRKTESPPAVPDFQETPDQLADLPAELRQLHELRQIRDAVDEAAGSIRIELIRVQKEVKAVWWLLLLAPIVWFVVGWFLVAVVLGGVASALAGAGAAAG